MQSYSELCAEARRIFMVAHAQGLNNVDTIVRFWGDAVEVAQGLAMGSSVRGLRFERVEFQDDAWKVVVDAMKRLEALGCAEKRKKNGHNVSAYVLKPEKFDPKKVEEHFADRRRGPRRKVDAPVAVPPTPEKVVQTVYQKPPRKEVDDSIAIVVDLANVTKRCDSGGRYMLPASRINWAAFRCMLQTYHGKTLPVERAVLCVSEHYYAMNASALRSAERLGFTVSKKNGQKEGDPVVVCELLDAVLGPLVKDHARIPVISLVSGDLDFSGVIDTLRAHVRTVGLDLRLRVTSWDEGLSYQLDKCAFDRVSIDSIVNRIRF